jgi:hypothetical protein
MAAYRFISGHALKAHARAVRATPAWWARRSALRAAQRSLGY